MPDYLANLLRRPPVGWWDLLDIALVSVLIYEFLKLTRGTWRHISQERPSINSMA